MRRDLLASRELAWRLMLRDIQAKYRQSLLGLFWAFVPPILTAVGLVLARKTGVVNIDDTNLPYPAFVIFSTALWQTFVEALNGPITAVVAAKPMLGKINFPREAIILAKLGEVFFNFGIKLILIVGIFLWFKMPITPSALLAPVALLHLVTLGTGLGLLLVPIGVLYGDVSKVLPLIVTPWLMITPVFYAVPASGLFAAVVRLNPVTPLLMTTRELATTGIVTDTLSFWGATGLAFGTLLIGWFLYRLAMPFLIERMGS
ncbi:MAG: ABC transporter permease [Cyanothece sp. SIO1E1]|nr:ABC transporter permease [Cyanothece sp. SIO1E1]